MTAEPLVPHEVDLRGLDYMPLFGNHLFGSEFNAAATDGEWRAALTLWWAAWNQVPAGSLPADDVALCRLADLGRDVKTWRKLKVRALHGFVECSDGRIYHRFICDQALVAWDKRVKERERKAKWRADQDAKRAGRNADGDGDNHNSSQGHGRGPDADVPAEWNGKDGTGRDDKEKDQARAASPPAGTTGFAPTAAGLACKAMRAAGLAATNPGDPRLAALLDQGATVDELAGLAAEAVGKGKGFAWVLATLQGRRSDAAAIALAPAASSGPSPPSRSTGALARMEADRMTPEQQAAADKARAAAMATLKPVRTA